MRAFALAVAAVRTFPESAPATREPLGFAAGGAALHVDDFVVTDGEDLEAFVATSVGSEPLGRADDLLAHLRELGLNLDPSLTAFRDLESQDLTGLVRPMSSGCVLPPEVAV